MATRRPILLKEIYEARRRIAGTARRTPLMPAPRLEAESGRQVRLKLETLQDTGAFKVRGAANAILSLDDAARRRGVVTYSTGNHGRAVAHVAGLAGVPATVCVSEQVTPGKIAALEASGCRLSIEGRSQDEAAARAARLAAADGLTAIDPINDRAVVAGHGTAGLELIEDWPEVDTVVVPVSGGALISGVALAVKSARPRCRVVGVSMARGAAMYESLKAGRPVVVDEVASLADSLQGGILLDNRYSFAMVGEMVDELVLVSEDEIAHAMAHAYWHERLILEGAAATPIAALLFRDPASFGDAVALVLTGNAVDGAVLADIASRYRDAVAGAAPAAVRGAA